MNGNPVYETSTDYNGHALVGDLSGLKNEQEPVAFIVETENDLSFMPYSSYGRNLDYSNFDVGGVYGSTDPEKINAFIFNDRGTYRPGEEVGLRYGLRRQYNYRQHVFPLCHGDFLLYFGAKSPDFVFRAWI